MSRNLFTSRQIQLVLLFLGFFLVTSITSLFGQEKLSEKMQLNGYIKYMNTAILPADDNGQMLTDNFFHNRLNYSWYVNENITFKTSMRNRFFYGEFVRALKPIYASYGDDNGFFDMSILWAHGESTALHTVFDRVNLTYQKNDLEIIIGRQRINWGMNLVWNPNDIFNSYSFFDFDYEERPGTDAVMVNYYTGATSSLSVVYQLADSLIGSAFAAKYKFNIQNYDVQFYGAYQKQYYVSGFGWAGDIKGAGFRGEGTYFIPESGNNGDNQFIGSIDLDYTLTNGLYLHAAYLYNSIGINADTGNYGAFYTDRNLSVQTLSPAAHNIYLETSGAFTPILTGSLSTMINPADGSWFAGPGVTWSVVENFDFLAFAQLFRGNPSTLFGDGGSIVFIRFKYSF